MATQAAPSYIFLLGANDSRTVQVSGYDAQRQITYEWSGNTNFSPFLALPEAAKAYMFVLWFLNDSLTFNRPDVIVNCIANADIMQKSLAKACDMLEQITEKWPDLYIMNHPAAILQTTRDKIYQKFHGLPGLHIPKTISFSPAGPDEILTRAAQEEIDFPFIVRRCGTHQGQSMALIESAAQKDKLEQFAYDGTAYYVTAYRDYKNDAGQYAKARLIVLDGAIYPRHYITSDHWIVHAGSRANLMDASADLKRQEQNFLDNFENTVSQAALASLRRIGDELGLDYVGADCAVLPGGELLIFEINASQNAMAPSDYRLFPYLQAPVAAIVDGFNALIKKNAPRAALKSAQA